MCNLELIPFVIIQIIFIGILVAIGGATIGILIADKLC